jgi:outer membrane lipoprotein SlyB
MEHVLRVIPSEEVAYDRPFQMYNYADLRPLLVALAIGGCGTLTGATVGGAAGAGIGAATHSNVGRSAAIGAGVGGTAGALYDIFGCCRSSNRRAYDD